MESKKELEGIDLQIVNYLKDRHNLTDGKCGVTIPELLNHLGKGFDELKDNFVSLNGMKYFRMRKGINGFLFFYNEKK